MVYILVMPDCQFGRYLCRLVQEIWSDTDVLAITLRGTSTTMAKRPTAKSMLRFSSCLIANAFQGDSVCHIISIPNWRGKILASTSATFIYLTAPRARR